MYVPYSIIFKFVHHLDFILWHYLYTLKNVWFPFGHCRSVVGELDEELDSSLDLSKLRAHPLKPVIH